MRKSVKNKLIIFTLIIMGIFFVGFKKVNADYLDYNAVTVECIYNDGGLYESSYNDYTQERVVNRYTYNLKGNDSDETNTNSSFNYVNSPLITYRYPGGGGDGHLECQKWINVGTNMEKKDDDEEAPITYASFSAYAQNTISIEAADRGWLSKLFKGNYKQISAHSYELVSENYVLTEKSGNPRYVLNYKRQNSDSEQQAVSDPKYISFLVYSNAVLIQGQSKINYIDVKNYNISGMEYNRVTGKIERGTPTEVLTISDPEPKAYVGNGSTVSYYFDDIRYSFNASGQRYVFAGESQKTDSFDNGDLCKKIMPNTAKIIAKVIGWCQILVPALLIVLVALDLSKLMLAGNIEEELPKQKKRIIVRFIAAVTVFFLPFIVKLALSNVKTSGSSIDEIDAIEYIDCIFEMIGTS